MIHLRKAIRLLSEKKIFVVDNTGEETEAERREREYQEWEAAKLEEVLSNTYQYVIYVYDKEQRKWYTKMLNRLGLDKNYTSPKRRRHIEGPPDYGGQWTATYDGYITMEQTKRLTEAMEEYPFGGPDYYTDDVISDMEWLERVAPEILEGL